MVAITATNYATPSAQAWQGRARLEQARSEADRAEARARQLRGQADEAEQQAQQGHDRVRAVSAQVAQADSTYSSQLRKQAAASQNQQLQSLLNRASGATSSALPDTLPPLSAKPWARVEQPATVGRFVNQSA